MSLSKKQTRTLELMKALNEELGNTWVHQAELPDITKHSLDALVQKGMIEQREAKVTGQMYYKLKSLNMDALVTKNKRCQI